MLSKAEFIRSMSPGCPASKVVMKAQEVGLSITSQYVYYVRRPPRSRTREATRRQAQRYKDKRKAKVAQRRKALAAQSDDVRYLIDCIRGVLRLTPLYDQGKAQGRQIDDLRRFGGVSYGQEVWMGPSSRENTF